MNATATTPTVSMIRSHEMKAPRAAANGFAMRFATGLRQSRKVRRTGEAAADHARMMMLIYILVGISITSLGLGWALAGTDLLLLTAPGIALTMLLFGGPFWICAMDDAAGQEQAHESLHQTGDEIDSPPQ